MFTLKINTDNDVFQDGNRGRELARLLRKIADDIKDLQDERWGNSIRDVNGATVGYWRSEL